MLKCLLGKHYNSRFLLLLSGDVSLNPGPFQLSRAVNTIIWEPLNLKRWHFLHIDINSLLPKIEGLKCMTSKTKTAIIRTRESKFDHTIPDLEVSLPA